MAGLIEIAATIMADAQRSVEVSAQNVSNITTAGYKRRIEFSSMMGSISEPEKSKLFQESAIDLAFGKISETGNPYDLGISGPGFFSVRSASGALLYTRDGQFSRDRDGPLIEPP
jgi:flagellar basal-body rod protein FlgG